MKLEFQPQKKPGAVMKSASVKDTSTDRTNLMLFGAVLVCVIGAVIMRVIAPAAPPPIPTVQPPPPPVAPEVFRTKLTDQYIDLYNWSDDPGALAKQLGFAAIFYHADPAFRRVQFRSEFYGEGRTIGEGGEFTIERIDPHVVFLRDTKDKLYRLIDEASWDEAIEKYRWGGASRPPDPQKRADAGAGSE
ncbi:MAG: hypothetical protein AB7K09_04055 [Planctomycetota bacterium]